MERACEDEERSVGVLNDLENMEDSLNQLERMVDNVLGYVNSVLDGSKEADPVIGRALMEALSCVSLADGKQLQGNLQDILSVIYLSNLTKAQLGVSERLQLANI